MSGQNTGSLGWLVIAAFAAFYDVFVMKRGQQSLSGAMWTYCERPYLGPAVTGFWTGLTWHFFIEKLVEGRNNEAT